MAVRLDPALSASEQHRFLSILGPRVDEHPADIVLLLGDWNYVRAEDLRVQPGGEASGDGDPIVPCGDFAELWHPLPTFGLRGEVGLSVLSRIGRIYSNMSVAMLVSLHSDELPSDHLPVLLRAVAKRSRVARLPRLSPELIGVGERWACFDRLSLG